MPFQKIESAVNNRSLVLLAPEGASLQPFSGRITFSSRLHSRLLEQMQRLRGAIYLSDGAVRESDLTFCGRHVSPLDSRSWHLLIMGRCDEGSECILGCTRFRRHPNTIASHDLGVSRAPIASCDVWGAGFRHSLDAELAAARRAGFAYVEIGGWALAPEVRGTTEALRSVLATYALAQLQGGALGISTATERNASACILRRLGGRRLEWNGSEIPPYFDPNYRCGMEILRFDSRAPSPRYVPMVRELRSTIARVPIVCPGEEQTCWSRLSLGIFGAPAFASGAARWPAIA